MLAVIVDCSEIVINVTSKRLLYLGGSLILGQGPVTVEKGLSSHQVASNASKTDILEKHRKNCECCLGYYLIVNH